MELVWESDVSGGASLRVVTSTDGGTSLRGIVLRLDRHKWKAYYWDRNNALSAPKNFATLTRAKAWVITIVRMGV